MKLKCPTELERWTKLKKNISNNLENLIAYTTGKWTGLFDILLSWDPIIFKLHDHRFL